MYKLFKLFTALLDAVILYGCVYMALRIKASGILMSAQNISDIENVLPFICVIGILLLYVNGLYATQERSAFDTLYAIILVVVFLTVITMALSFFLRSFAFPRSVIAMAALLQWLLLSVWRMAALPIGRALHGKQTVLVVGHNGEIQRMAKKILLSPGRLYEIKFLFDLEKEYKIMRKLISQVDHVFVCPHITREERQIIFSACLSQNTSVFMIPDLFDISVKNAALQPFDDIPVFKIGQLRLTWEQKVIKRVFDVGFSSIIVVLTSPLMLISALLIKLTSSGPVLYKQERITENNKVFNVLKLRTMYDGAEEETGPVLAAEKDTRVTRVGAFLRATRVDELPQFFNVLAGDMSVVGPRPERPFFIEQFKKELPDYEYRATVKAGITGYAQVMGKYTTSYEDKLRYDLLYIKNWSFWLDVTLIIQTIKVLFIADSSQGVVDNKSIQ